MLGLDTYENLARSGIDFASLLEEDEEEENVCHTASSITDLPIMLLAAEAGQQVTNSP